MKKLFLILTLLAGTFTFVACGKKDKNNNACPSGQIQVTDSAMLQMLNSNGYGGYNNGYNYNSNNNGNVCVDQYRYQQLQQQMYGYNSGNNSVNCQQYPSAPGCNTNNYNGGNNNNGGWNYGNTDPYCDYYPYSSYCTGGGGYYSW